MKNQRLWLTVVVLLACIWSGVAVVMHLTDEHVSWPEKVSGLMSEAPWLHGNRTQPRQPYLDSVIANVNRLDFQQSRRLREDAPEIVQQFFTSLTADEQKIYVNRTLERHFETIERGLKLMPQDERKRLTTRMTAEMRGLLSRADQELVEAMVEDDPLFFLRNLPTKTKMEIGPAIENMVSRVQGSGRR